MKINNKKMSYEEVLKLPRLQHKKPLKPQMWLATIVRIVCEETLRKIKCHCKIVIILEAYVCLEVKEKEMKK